MSERDFFQLQGVWSPEWVPHCSLGSSAGARPSAASCLRPLASAGGSAGRAHLEGPHGSRGKEWMLPQGP